MKQIDLREGARRQHRAIALFAVIQCWLRSLDGLVIDRPHLERLLGLERFKATRVDWLQEDFREFFPHQETYWYQSPKSFGALYAARKSIAEHLPQGTMSDEQRLAQMPAGGPVLGMLRMWPHPDPTKVMAAFEAAVPFFADAVNYDERLLSSYLALLCQGQISPSSLPHTQARK